MPPRAPQGLHLLIVLIFVPVVKVTENVVHLASTTTFAHHRGMVIIRAPLIKLFLKVLNRVSMLGTAFKRQIIFGDTFEFN